MSEKTFFTKGFRFRIISAIAISCIGYLNVYSQRKDEGAFESKIMDMRDLTPLSFPVIDGSDSTEPLRDIIMCKLLGYSYAWERSPFVQDEMGIKGIKVDYACSEEERRVLQTKKLLYSNTHQSFINLIDGNVELIVTARDISRDEKKYADEREVSLHGKPIALDALTFMVHPQNKVNNITPEQIQLIYTGQLKNWKELGGEDMEIHPYIRNRNSGSQEKFETIVMNGVTLPDYPILNVGTTMLSPYYQLDNDPKGIAFTPFYYYRVIVDTNSTKALAVNGVEMNKTSIKDGSYPYGTQIYVNVRSDISRETTAYRLFEFLTTREGQDIVEESGYVPMPKESGVVPKSDDVSLYVKNKVLYISDKSKIKKIQITDLQGRVISCLNVEENKIDLSTLAHGVYLVGVELIENKMLTKKVFI
jgi:periplasmic phosphate-binding protein